jgi:glucose-1-phosphate thymidylyltransferase
MKGVILAGGLGTRLYPLTQATNKHLLPVYDKPMVYHPISTLVNAGIKDILIVTGGPHAGDFVRVLRNGEDFGLEGLNYAYQEGEGGIAAALRMARSFVGDDKCVVVLGDNIIADDISAAVREHDIVGGACIFTKKVPDPERFGVVKFDDEGMFVDIIEKPEVPPSNSAVIGLYMYDETVFDKIEKLSPSGRGELEVTDLNRAYLEEGRLTIKEVHGTWMDCGTFDSLALATKTFYEDE